MDELMNELINKKSEEFRKHLLNMIEFCKGEGYCENSVLFLEQQLKDGNIIFKFEYTE